MTYGTPLRLICQVRGCLGQHRQTSDQCWCQCSSRQNERWPHPLVVERDKAVKACPSKKALSIGTAGSITPVDMWTIKIASIENSVREYWEIRRLQSHRWSFVDNDHSITHQTHNHLVSDVVGD